MLSDTNNRKLYSHTFWGGIPFFLCISQYNSSTGDGNCFLRFKTSFLCVSIEIMISEIMTPHTSLPFVVMFTSLLYFLFKVSNVFTQSHLYVKIPNVSGVYKIIADMWMGFVRWPKDHTCSLYWWEFLISAFQIIRVM